MKTITILEVKGPNKVWAITRCDDNPELVGSPTACGVPCRGKDVPEGTTYKQILTIPRGKKK